MADTVGHQGSQAAYDGHWLATERRVIAITAVSRRDRWHHAPRGRARHRWNRRLQTVGVREAGNRSHLPGLTDLKVLAAKPRAFRKQTGRADS